MSLDDFGDRSEWRKGDAKAKATIGVTLSDEYLEYVRGCPSAVSMWKAISDLSQRWTLLNRLAAGRKFYIAQMLETERVMSYISRVRQLAADLKAVDTDVEDQELAMTVLCGLPSKFEHLIVAIDAVADDKTLTLEFVRSRLLQEEQRMSKRLPDITPSDTLLVNKSEARNRFICTH